MPNERRAVLFVEVEEEGAGTPVAGGVMGVFGVAARAGPAVGTEQFVAGVVGEAFDPVTGVAVGVALEHVGHFVDQNGGEVGGAAGVPFLIARRGGQPSGAEEDGGTAGLGGHAARESFAEDDGELLGSLVGSVVPEFAYFREELVAEEAGLFGEGGGVASAAEVNVSNGGFGYGGGSGGAAEGAADPTEEEEG